MTCWTKASEMAEGRRNNLGFVLARAGFLSRKMPKPRDLLIQSRLSRSHAACLSLLLHDMTIVTEIAILRHLRASSLNEADDRLRLPGTV